MFNPDIDTHTSVFDSTDAIIRSPILVISGFSGAGKGEVLKHICQERRTVDGRPIHLVTSVTTRKKRSPDDNYIFLTQEQFEGMVSAGLLLEHNDAYSSNRYGTPVSGVLEAISKGAIPCLEIDQNGLSQLLTEGKAEPHQIRSVFITATASGLNKRLHKRNTESEPAIRRRLMNSLDETQNLHLYSAIVNNRDDDLESTVEKVMHAFEGRPRSDTFDAVVFRNEMEQILKNGST